MLAISHSPGKQPLCEAHCVLVNRVPQEFRLLEKGVCFRSEKDFSPRPAGMALDRPRMGAERVFGKKSAWAVAKDQSARVEYGLRIGSIDSGYG